MMALSRFTPWFAVSALMPLGSSSTHSFHLDSGKKYKCYVKAFPIYFSFIHHLKFMHIFTPQIMLVYLQRPSIWYSVGDIGEIKYNLCIIFKYRGYR